MRYECRGLIIEKVRHSQCYNMLENKYDKDLQGKMCIANNTDMQQEEEVDDRHILSFNGSSLLFSSL